MDQRNEELIAVAKKTSNGVFIPMCATVGFTYGVFQSVFSEKPAIKTLLDYPISSFAFAIIPGCCYAVGLSFVASFLPLFMRPIICAVVLLSAREKIKDALEASGETQYDFLP